MSQCGQWGTWEDRPQAALRATLADLMPCPALKTWLALQRESRCFRRAQLHMHCLMCCLSSGVQRPRTRVRFLWVAILAWKLTTRPYCTYLLPFLVFYYFFEDVFLLYNHSDDNSNNYRLAWKFWKKSAIAVITIRAPEVNLFTALDMLWLRPCAPSSGQP